MLNNKNQNGVSILIIDDEPLSGKTLTAIFKSKGFISKYSLYGKEGLELLEDGFDILILDLKLPDMNGMDILKQTKKLYPETIVILVTAYASVDTAIDAMNEGAYTYLMKPFDVDILVQTIEQALEERKINVKKERLVSNLSLLYKVSKELEGVIELHSISRLAARYLADVTEIDICAILLMDAKNKQFYFGALSGHENEKDILEQKRFKLDEKLYKRLVDEQNAVLIPKLKVKLQILEYIDVNDPKSLFIFPLVTKNKVIGLCLLISQEEASLEETVVEAISTIGSEVAECIENANRYLALKHNYLSAVTSLVSSIESKHLDPKRSEMVSERAAQVATRMKLPKDEIEYIRFAGLLHDIGKVAISEQILFKEDSLTAEEFVKVKTHCLVSTSIIRKIDTEHRLVPIILYHHERYDGGGYPEGLRGEGIPIGARILAVCDAFEAMLSKRPYRQALTEDEAVEELKRCAGAQFDSQVVDAFVEIFTKENNDREEKV
ncbi:MAG: response regulator [PVC group bacterium]|nr:response regulator [PVC group bacterium]